MNNEAPVNQPLPSAQTDRAAGVLPGTAGGSLRDAADLDLLARRWADWACSAPDVGIQTRSVLASAGPPRSALDAG